MCKRSQIAAVLCVFLRSFFALGQSSTQEQPGKMIRISGRVVDAVNLPLPATTVTLTVPGSTSPDHSVLTDADGRFSLPLLSSLSYDLKFTKAGFRSVSIRVASDTIGNDIELGTAVLQIGKTTEGPMFPAKAPKLVKPVTVCDVLADLKRFSGKPVAIAGRLDCSWSLTDHTCHLAEDKCDRPVVTQGFVWPNKITLMENWEEGTPKPPTESPEIESAAVLQKLSLISQTTLLGFHKEPLFRTKDSTIIYSRMADVKDVWGAAFGLLFTTPNLKKDGCGEELGCGGFDGAPAALIINAGSTHTYDDSEVPPYPVKR
jgi:hypothetical protein